MSEQKTVTYDFVVGKVKKYITVKWYRHEALHSTHLLIETVSNNIAEHYYYNSNINPEFNKKIDEAINALCDAYQLCNKENEIKNSNPNLLGKIKNPNWKLFKKINKKKNKNININIVNKENYDTN